MQIQPITEAAYNTAKMTLDAMRQELLFYREEYPKSEKMIVELQEKVAELEEKTRPTIIRTGKKDANHPTNIRDDT